MTVASSVQSTPRCTSPASSKEKSSTRACVRSLLGKKARGALGLGVFEQDGIGLFPVTARSSRLLGVCLQAGRVIIMQHEANFRFIDAHAEGVSRHHHVEFALHKLLLNLMPFRS